MGPFTSLSYASTLVEGSSWQAIKNANREKRPDILLHQNNVVQLFHLLLFSSMGLCNYNRHLCCIYNRIFCKTLPHYLESPSGQFLWLVLFIGFILFSPIFLMKSPFHDTSANRYSFKTVLIILYLLSLLLFLVKLQIVKLRKIHQIYVKLSNSSQQPFPGRIQKLMKNLKKNMVLHIEIVRLK